MKELNRELHEAFGLKWTCNIRCGIPMEDRKCDYCVHYERASNQDLLAQIEIPCGECGGTGLTCNPPPRSEAWSPSDCPTCDGLKARRITRLQQIIEERGEWNEFYIWHLSNHSPSIFLDANKFGQSVLAWKKQTIRTDIPELANCSNKSGESSCKHLIWNPHRCTFFEDIQLFFITCEHGEKIIVPCIDCINARREKGNPHFSG